MVVLVPEAEALVDEYRREFDRSAMQGLPAHITILYPFRSPRSITTGVLADLRQVFAPFVRFAFSLSRIDQFASTIYLAPEPPEPFNSLTLAVVRRFPDCPPYGGAVDSPIPHLTVAQQPPARNLIEVRERIRAKLEHALPVQCSASEVSLIISRSSRWTVAERLALGSGDERH